MNKLKFGVVFFFFLLVQTSYGQRWGLDPTLSFLKGQKDLKIEFLYDSMTVTTCIDGLGFYIETKTEFIKEKKDKFNQQTAGKGDKWADEWYSARKIYFEPLFEKKFKGKLQKKGINADRQNNGAKYTIIVKTTGVVFGKIVPKTIGSFNNFSKNSRGTKSCTYCDYFITIVDTKDHSQVLARGSAKLLYGRHIPVFSLHKFRAILLKDCYEKAGSKFGRSAIKALSK
ncbi:MAG: hypothetical protein ABI388_02365 [Bacteroidia bacterium]